MNAIQLTLDAQDWQKQVNLAVKTLEKLTYNFEREQRAILEDAAEIVISEVQSRAPRSSRPHVRYPSLSEGTGKAAKGFGRPVAIYYPGNLKRSFGVLKLKRTSAVIVGAMLHRAGKTRGTFSGRRADGYYLGFVEYDVEFGSWTKPGRPFVRPSYIAAAPRVINRVHSSCNKFAANFARKYAAAQGRE